MKTLIVGASGEIGGAVAQRFADEGAEVILHGHTNRRRLEEMRHSLPGAVSLVADLRDPQACRALIEQASPPGSPIDVLIVASGVNPSADSVAETTGPDLEETLAVNLMAPFRLVGAAIPHLRARRGVIVLVSSIFGINAPANRGAYSISKHGLTGLVQTVAREEGAHLRINAICPGPVWSENVRHIFAEHARHKGIEFEDYYRQRVGAIPVGRFLDPVECAAICWLLASADSSYINGQAIPVTGGAIT